MKDRLDVLDGWRTISVALVIVDHLLVFSNVRITTAELDPYLGALGTLGVQIFFVISGFVICLGLIREANRFGRVSLTGFYLRRFLRIVPPLVLYIAIVMLLVRVGVVNRAAASVDRALTFTCNFPNADCGSYLGAHTWSLSVEEQFYLVIPALFLVMHRHQKTASAFLFALPVLALFVPHASGFVVNFLPICIGVICAFNERRLRLVAQRAPAWLLWAAFAGLLVGARASYTRLAFPAAITTSLLIAAVLILSIARSGRFTRLLSSLPMTAVGRASYGIYLWQQLATYAFAGAGFVFYAVSVAVCISASIIMFRLVEMRLISLGRRISAGQTKKALATFATGAHPKNIFTQ